MENYGTPEQHLGLSSDSSCCSSWCLSVSCSDWETDEATEGHTNDVEEAKGEADKLNSLILDREEPPIPTETNNKCFRRKRSSPHPRPEKDKEAEEGDVDKYEGRRYLEPDRKRQAIDLRIEQLPRQKSRKMGIESHTVFETHPVHKRSSLSPSTFHSRHPSVLEAFSVCERPRPHPPVMPQEKCNRPPAPRPELAHDHPELLSLNDFNEAIFDPLRKGVRGGDLTVREALRRMKEVGASEDLLLEDVRGGQEENASFTRFRSARYRPRYKNYRPSPCDGPPVPPPARRDRRAGRGGH